MSPMFFYSNGILLYIHIIDMDGLRRRFEYTGLKFYGGGFFPVIGTNETEQLSIRVSRLSPPAARSLS